MYPWLLCAWREASTGWGLGCSVRPGPGKGQWYWKLHRSIHFIGHLCLEKWGSGPRPYPVTTGGRYMQGPQPWLGPRSGRAEAIGLPRVHWLMGASPHPSEKILRLRLVLVTRCRSSGLLRVCAGCDPSWGSPILPSGPCWTLLSLFQEKEQPSTEQASHWPKCPLVQSWLWWFQGPPHVSRWASRVRQLSRSLQRRGEV